MTHVFVCLDMQRAFIPGGPFAAPKAASAILRSRRLLAAARELRWTIVHCHLHRLVDPLQIHGSCAYPAQGFEPGAREIVLERSSLSAYGHAAFEAYMQDACGRVLVTGLSASITWLATMFDAFERDHMFAFTAGALAAQSGAEADADQHESVARDVATLLGFRAIAAPTNGPSLQLITRAPS